MKIIRIDPDKKSSRLKTAIALSGGVDSGVTAALMVKAGYQAAGFHMHLWSEKPKGKQTSFNNKCCDFESEKAARATASKLGIPFYVVHFEKQFKKAVVDYFLKEYGLGRTPNPCVVCNRLIKFGELLKYVKKLGYDYLATGHYARIGRVESGSLASLVSGPFISLTSEELKTTNVTLAKRHTRSDLLGPTHFSLLSAKDEVKDQSYFLYSLTQKQLAHLMFPVGDYPKKEVVAMAKKWRLPVAKRPESQEVCFYPERDYRPFLKRQISIKIKPGKVIDAQGDVIGRHLGLPLYTIGQRHGFKIDKKQPRMDKKVSESLSSLIPPFYVVSKDVRKNQLVVGFGQETEKKEFWVKEVNWISRTPRGGGQKCLVRIRHQGELLKCKIQISPVRDRTRSGKIKITNQNSKSAKKKKDSRVNESQVNELRVILDHPQRGVAPGQVAVLYKRLKVRNPRPHLARRGGQKSKFETYEVLGGGIIK